MTGTSAREPTYPSPPLAFSMDAEIPAGWPPEPGTVETREVPMFPLPNVYLVPGTFMPLHVFEPRYRQMVEDCLDGPGRIAMGTVLPGFEDEMPGSPPVHHVAGLGEIVRHERLRDGRFLIVLFGLVRARIREVASDRLYRKVQAEPVHDVAPPKDVRDAFRERLAEAILARNTELLNIPETLALGHMADLLLLQLGLPQERMLALYSEPDVARRVEGVLAEHLRRPIEPDGDSGHSGANEPRETM